MLRQALTTSSRAIGSSVRVAAHSPLIRTQLLQQSSPTLSFVARRATFQQTTRWYSDEAKPAAADAAAAKEREEADKTESSKGEEAATSTDPKEALTKEIEAKTKEVLEWKDRYLRSVADFRNLQDRQAREMTAARNFAIQKFAKDLVDSVDNLDRALAVVPEEKLKQKAEDHETTEHLKDLVNLYEGIKMTETILMQTLQKHGLERYDPHGSPFDPNEHEATFMAPQPDKEHNTVFHTQQKGFKLHGRVLRPAKVGVVRNK